MKPSLVLGARASPLSRAQATWVQEELAARDIPSRVVFFITAGDRILDKPLADIGGKGLFTQDIEAALWKGEIDLAVHSLKDVPTVLPDGLLIAAIPERADVRDAWFARNPAWKTPMDLPPGSTIGTASLRRQVQLQEQFSYTRVESIRGNIGTRLEKMQRGDVDGLVLSLAGFQRLRLENHVQSIFSTQAILPAVGQGALALECCSTRTDVIELLHSIHHPPTATCVRLEREFLQALDGSCRTPIGGYARFNAKGHVLFEGLLGNLEKHVVSRIQAVYDPGDPSVSLKEFSQRQAQHLLNLHQRHLQGHS